MKIAAWVKRLAAPAALALGIAIAPVAAQAHSDAQPQEHGELIWRRITMIRFHEGARDRAFEIIKNYFDVADRLAGVPKGQQTIHLRTSEWDMVYFDLILQPQDIEEDEEEGIHKDNKWLAVMIELAGSEEEANRINDEFQSLIALRVEHVGHEHLVRPADW